jgi:hypothetical protein
MNHLLQAVRLRAPLLLLAAAVMLLVLGVSLAGLVLDARVITGAPAWLKPAKFSASVAIYCVTLAWILTLLPAERGLRRVGHLIATLLILEVALIVLQVVRGTSSHFNLATPFDGVLFRVMGAMIAIVMVGTMYVLWRAWRVPFADPGLGTAIRTGLLITIVGGWLGAVMTVPTAAQRQAMAAGEPVRVQGGHAVGAPEDGPGLPLVRWSTTGGDLRVAHFFGLHGVQALPLMLVAIRRRRGPAAGDGRLIVFLGAAYLVLVVAAFLQALAGRPFLPLAGS